MVRFTGDLSPRASGSASLGVEMNDGVNKFTTDIRPYAHVHMNSGIFHDPLQGQSGVLRFNHEQGVFEVSVDGGATFDFISVGAHGGGGAGTLQEAYEGDNNIFTVASDGGPVNIQGIGVSPLSLATDGRPHIQMSGLIGLHTTSLSRGDLFMQSHTAAWTAQLTGESAPTTQAEADTLSLGPALPFYSTGSGVTNLMIASGIGTFINATDVAFDQDAPAILDAANDLTSAFSDDQFFVTTPGSGVRIMVAGTYCISHVSTIEKTDGNFWQAVTGAPRIRDLHGNEFIGLGAENTTSLRDSSLNNFSTISSTYFADLDVSETVYLRFSVADTPLPDFDIVRIAQFGAALTIEYVGPKRLGKMNRIKKT